MTTPLFPNIKVKLSDEDGNAFYILAKMRKALVENHVPTDEVQLFLTSATGGDYNNLLATCDKWVTVE